MNSLLLLFTRITKILRINQIAYVILKRITRRLQAVPQFTDWKEYLRQLNPDVGGSCLCKNEIASEEELVNLEIIIPVYNTEQYVAECIESALSQKTKYTYRVIIVNDGSTDCSSEIINKYAHDNRIRIINQENRGFSGARNRALEHIGGEYVTFLDSDDRLPDGAIENLLDKAYEGNYDIVGGGYIRFEGTTLRPKTIPRPGQLFGFPWGKVYKAHLWNEHRFPEQYWFEDTVFAMVIHDCAKSITSIEEVVYDYRINRNGISALSTGKPKVIDSFWITAKLLNDRNTSSLPFDEKFQNQLLHQFKVNTIRIYSLGDKQANMAVFLGSRELYFHYYNNKCPISANSQIEDAIINNNFRQFLYACLFL